MITICKTELNRLINLVSAAKAEAEDLFNDPAIDGIIAALAKLKYENMLALECKLINVRDSGSKRIGVV